MGDDEGSPLDLIEGAHVGDFTVRVVPVTGTDGHLDLPESRERTERALEDEEAAKHSGNVAPEHPMADPAHPAPVPVIPLGEGGDVDASIEEARARAAEAAPEAAEVPVLLRDPVTGEVVASIEGKP